MIKSPGRYEIYENMTLADLILQAGGVDKNVHSINVEISNAINETLFNSKGPLKIADVNSFIVEKTIKSYILVKIKKYT